MAEFYAVQIKLGNIGIDDVPEKFRAKVELILEENN